MIHPLQIPTVTELLAMIKSVPAMLVMALTALRRICFCRLALEKTSIDAASFTLIRLLSGRGTCDCLPNDKEKLETIPSTSVPILALFFYMACFFFRLH